MKDLGFGDWGLLNLHHLLQILILIKQNYMIINLLVCYKVLFSKKSMEKKLRKLSFNSNLIISFYSYYFILWKKIFSNN